MENANNEGLQTDDKDPNPIDCLVAGQPCAQAPAEERNCEKEVNDVQN